MEPVLGTLAVVLMYRTVALSLTELARSACAILVERSKRATVIAIVRAVPEGSIAMEERPGHGNVVVVRGQPVSSAERAPAP